MNKNIIDDMDWLVRRKFPAGPVPSELRFVRDRLAQFLLNAGPTIPPSRNAFMQDRSPFLPLPKPKLTRAEQEQAELIEQRRTAATNFCDHLATLSFKEIEQLVADEREIAAQELRETAEREERNQPYHQPSAAPDYRHFNKLALWTLDQFVALAICKSPHVVDWPIMLSRYGVSELARRYAMVRELACAGLVAGQVFDPAPPQVWLSWAKCYGIPVEPILFEKALNDGLSMMHWRDVAEQRLDRALRAEAELEKMKSQAIASTATASAPTAAATLRFRTAQKVILGLAKEHYAFDPVAKKNSAAPRISGGLLRQGIRVSEDTIRSLLKEASEEVEVAAG